MTADERMLTDEDWEDAMLDFGMFFGGDQWGDEDIATGERDRLRADRAARIEQVERLRGLLRRCEPIVSEAILAARAGDPGFTEDALTDVLTDIRAELAREGQGWR